MGDDHTRSRSRSRERTSRRHDERELDKERERDKGRRSRSRSPRRHDRSRSPRHRRSRSRERERSSKKHRKRSVSASSASSSDSESGRHKHKRKKRSKSEERYRKEKKQRKREKKERASALPHALKSLAEFGCLEAQSWNVFILYAVWQIWHYHGYRVCMHFVLVFLSLDTNRNFIRSIYNKSSEFHTWLVEERKINPETVTKDQNRKEFARFVEDFNTGASCFQLLKVT